MPLPSWASAPLNSYPDGWLEDGPEFRGKLVHAIRKYRPDIVITHDPTRRYMGHHDHRITGIVCMDAIFPYSRDHLFYPKHKVEGLTPFKVSEVYLTGPEEPNKFIDISQTFELKMKAISCHVSQVGNHADDWETWIKGRRAQAETMAKERGLPIHEAFHRIEIRR
jgi:LmbE family N-acetylglucosaminyl deacetylase